MYCMYIVYITFDTFNMSTIEFMYIVEIQIKLCPVI